MSACISSSGRVCLCEYRGPVDSAMVVSLLSHLKRAREVESECVLLVLELDLAATRSIARGVGPFLGALPVLRDCCLEVVVATETSSVVARQLKRMLEAGSDPCSCQSAKMPRCYESLDEAFTYIRPLFPHNVLELERRRLRGRALPLDTQNQRTQ